MRNMKYCLIQFTDLIITNRQCYVLGLSSSRLHQGGGPRTPQQTLHRVGAEKVAYGADEDDG